MAFKNMLQTYAAPEWVRKSLSNLPRCRLQVSVSPNKVELMERQARGNQGSVPYPTADIFVAVVLLVGQDKLSKL